MEYSCAKVALALKLRESAEHGGPRLHELRAKGTGTRFGEKASSKFSALGLIIERPLGEGANLIAKQLQRLPRSSISNVFSVCNLFTDCKSHLWLLSQISIGATHYDLLKWGAETYGPPNQQFPRRNMGEAL